MNNHMVLVTFDYWDPKTSKPFKVQRGWPCKDQDHAKMIVQHYGMKTGSVGAECVMEEIDYEKIK
jgi:hypothetical protein